MMGMKINECGRTFTGTLLPSYCLVFFSFFFFLIQKSGLRISPKTCVTMVRRISTSRRMKRNNGAYKLRSFLPFQGYHAPFPFLIRCVFYSFRVLECT